MPERNVSLAPHTSLRVGGAAEYFLTASSGQQIAEGLRWARDQGVPVRVIGGGSNLLVSERGVEGLVIKAANARWTVDGDVVRADAGVTLAGLARRLAKQGCGGLEWAANVPGSVGGAAVNNAGAFGGDMAHSLVAVTLVNVSGSRTRLEPDTLQYGYRTSVLKRRQMGDTAVESVELTL